MRAHIDPLTPPATHLCNVTPAALLHTLIICSVSYSGRYVVSYVHVLSNWSNPCPELLLCDSSSQQPRWCCPVTNQHFQLCFNKWQISTRSNTTNDSCNRKHCGGIAISSYNSVILHPCNLLLANHTSWWYLC